MKRNVAALLLTQLITSSMYATDTQNLPFDLNLGAQFVNTPPGVNNTAFVTSLPVTDFNYLRSSVAHYAIKEELLDPREDNYLLRRVDAFSQDLEVIRRRREDLKDVPHIVDGDRFPKRNFANAQVAFNRKFHKFIEDRKILQVDRIALLDEISAENQTLYQVWDSVRDATSDYYYVTVRRLSLQKLKTLIGEENYQEGILPPNVPVWRFNSLEQR